MPVLPELLEPVAVGSSGIVAGIGTSPPMEVKPDWAVTDPESDPLMTIDTPAVSDDDPPGDAGEK